MCTINGVTPIRSPDGKEGNDSLDFSNEATSGNEDWLQDVGLDEMDQNADRGVSNEAFEFDQLHPLDALDLDPGDHGSLGISIEWPLHIDEEGDSPNTDIRDLLHTPKNAHTLDVPQNLDQDFNWSSPISFPFLSRFTRAIGFVNSFECGSLLERQILARQLGERERCHSNPFASSSRLRSDSSTALSFDQMLSHGLDADFGWEDPRLDPTLMPLWNPQFKPATDPSVDLVSTSPMYRSEAFPIIGGMPHEMRQSDLQWQPWSSDEIAFKTYEIVDKMRGISCNKPRGSKIAINWSPLLEKMCLDFFSPPNLRKHLAFFWSSWYPNCPIIHRPTFSIAKAQHELLASMVLMGGCMSPDSRDRASANIWFNSLEELIFTSEELYDEIAVDRDYLLLDSTVVQRRLEILQAAYFICLTQNWEGSRESKQRIRRHRYSTVIAFVRDFKISNATLKHLRTNDIGMFKWDKFILQESLIRTFIYVFLFDAAFVIFNNSPPRMVVLELTMDLACPESCFQATSSEECFVCLNSWSYARDSPPTLDLSSAVEIICRPQISEENQKIFSSLSTLNMFAIITGLHCLAFNINSSFMSKVDMSPTHTGIANWKRFWHATTEMKEPDHLESDLVESMWKRIGFIRHAPEFWQLVKASLANLNRLHPSSIRENNMVNRVERGSTSRPPARYDDEDMRQVNALITSLQEMGLSAQ